MIRYRRVALVAVENLWSTNIATHPHARIVIMHTVTNVNFKNPTFVHPLNFSCFISDGMSKNTKPNTTKKF
jgi:preprotein translocase subunit SecB